MDLNLRTTAGAWIAGAATWLVAALVGAGAEDGSARFTTAEGIWLTAQLLVLAGLVGLTRLPSRPDRGRRLGTTGLVVALVGRVVFVIAEGVSIATGEPAEAILPVGALLTAVGMTLFGVAVVRAHRWDGWPRWAPLAMGVYPFLFMFPLVATGAPPEPSIALWALPMAGVGAAIGRDGKAALPAGVVRATPAVLVLVGLTVGLTGCGDDGEGADGTGEVEGSSSDAGADAAADAQVVEVTIPGGPEGEYTLDADLDGLTAGLVTVHLTNHGALEHQAMLLRLHEGEDVGSFVAAAAADPSGTEALSLVDGFGGPNGVAPGETRSTTQVLEPGDYVLICVIPDETGAPHAAHGMLVPFSVAPPETTDPVPALVDDPADADIPLVDFGFGLDGTYEPGDTVTVANQGEQAHELAIYRLGEEITFDAAAAALRDPASGPPPSLVPAGGIGALAPGATAQLTLPEEPGRYVVVCFIPDVTGDGQPHSAHGMIAELTLD